MVGKDLGVGSKCQTLIFSEHGHVAYQIDPMPVPDPRDGLKGWDQKVKIQFFSEHGHVAYQIKGNHGCSNMVAIFCPQTP